MPLVYKKGDVTKSRENIIAHGVNCQGVMGSGVALAIANKWPWVKERYLQHHKEVGWKLRHIQYVSINKGLTVANCATQNKYLPRGVLHADYDAIHHCMRDLAEYCQLGNYTVAMPKIGAGLAGGEWDIISRIIETSFGDREVKIYVYP